jgi:membrane fusion protein, multidrug efflux system
MRFLAGAVMLAALVVSGCGGTPATSQRAAEPELIEVESATAISTEVPDVLEAIGSLRARDVVTVSSEVGATVAEVAADFGDRIAEGDLLVRLDDHQHALRAAAARAALAQAEAVLARARSNYARAQKLQGKGVLSDDLFDAATSELRVSEANREAAAKQLALAEDQVADTVIRSPLKGFITVRYVTAGQYVTPYSPVMEIVAVDPLKLRIDAPERQVGAIRPGLPVAVRTDAFPDKVFQGTVTRVGAALDANTRTLPVESEVPNAEALLKPGQFAHVSIDLGTTSSTVVPRSAVDTFAGTHRAFVADPDGTLHARSVTLGRDLGKTVVVLAGVAAGETVITSHLERLADGQRVRIHSGGPA